MVVSLLLPSVKAVAAQSIDVADEQNNRPSVSAKGPEILIQKNQKGGFHAAKFVFSSRVEIKSFYLSDPPRFIVDFIGAELTDGQKLIGTGTPDVAAIRIAQFSADPDIVRSVFDLSSPKKFAVKQEENGSVTIVAEAEGNAAFSALPFPDPAIEKLFNRTVLKINFKEVPKYEKLNDGKNNEFDIDFYGYKPKDALKEIPINAGLIESVKVAHYEKKGDITRVSIITKMPAAITTDESEGGKNLTITVYQPSLYGAKITLDPGHGGKDPGAITDNGLIEKDIVLDIALRLKTLLESAGAIVTMTRDTDDFIPLDDRAFIANRSGAELFLSIHANALPDHGRKLSCRGLQMLYYSDESKEYANVMQGELLDMLKTGDQGLSVRKLVVLRKTQMKAVLAELGFITHPNDGQLFRNDVFRENAARGLYNGLLRYKGGKGVKLAALALPAEMQAQLPGGVIVNKYLASGAISGNANKTSAGINTDVSGEDGIYVIQQEINQKTAGNEEKVDAVIKKGSPTNFNNPKLEQQR